MELFDTHSHIGFAAFAGEDVVLRAREGGVSCIVVPGVTAEESATNLERFRQASGVWVAAGHHPSSAGLWRDEDVLILRQVASDAACIAIGECGLDGVKADAGEEVQERVLRTQLELALELDMPVILHTRGREERVLDIVRDYAGLRGVAHCYTGCLETALGFTGVGMYIGVTGIVTYPGSGALRELLKELPRERVLLETDAPYLPPQSKRGQRNEPAYVREVGGCVAEVWGVSEEEVARMTMENGRRLFGVGGCTTK